MAARRSTATDRWLSPAQERVWRAWMAVTLRLDHEMNRQLQEDSGLSIGDYHVLVALSGADGHRLQLTALAATIGWERSRLSHHLARMAARDLVERRPSTRDRRATDAVLTPDGLRAVRAAAPRHADLVRRLVFDVLDERDTDDLARALGKVYGQLIKHGSIREPPRG
ncbi:MarR family winged helix-turn-helix transcriptional regulator [Nakamurella endophytica]|uniref:MarR family winged helix-turn-helix transcriptional regulator n=1 Tax=Nakamurella endophytica TaxID=1748367 RepID=UPI001E3C89AE|nr:MarR family winged helix-turn-helix transcriptional regulator [Nakamurella endophytica]